MSRKTGNAQSRTRRFRDSAVLRLPDVLLRKVPNFPNGSAVFFDHQVVGHFVPRYVCVSRLELSSNRARCEATFYWRRLLKKNKLRRRRRRLLKKIEKTVERNDRELIIQYGRQFFKGDKMFLHCTESRWETKRQQQIHWNMRLSAHKFSFIEQFFTQFSTAVCLDARMPVDVWHGHIDLSHSLHLKKRIPFLVFSPGVVTSARRSIKERVRRRCEYISYR